MVNRTSRELPFTHVIVYFRSFDITDGGEVVLPTTVILRNRVTRLAGRMTGVHELIIERDSTFYVLDSAHTSQVYGVTGCDKLKGLRI